MVYSEHKPHMGRMVYLEHIPPPLKKETRSIQHTTPKEGRKEDLFRRRTPREKAGLFRPCMNLRDHVLRSSSPGIGSLSLKSSFEEYSCSSSSLTSTSGDWSVRTNTQDYQSRITTVSTNKDCCLTRISSIGTRRDFISV